MTIRASYTTLRDSIFADNESDGGPGVKARAVTDFAYGEISCQYSLGIDAQGSQLPANPSRFDGAAPTF